MGFRIRRYGRMDHIVAESRLHGNGSGEVLLAVMLKHRPGSADRVAPDEVQQCYANYLASAGDMAEVLRSMVATFDRMPFVTRYLLDADMQRARDLLGPLPPLANLTGLNPEDNPNPGHDPDNMTDNSGAGRVA